MKDVAECDHGPRLRLFGGPVLEVRAGMFLEPISRKGRLLMTFLGLRAGRWVWREEVTLLLWPDLVEARARACLDTELWRLRKALALAPEWLEAVPGRLRLAPLGEPAVDVGDFRDILRSAVAADAPDAEALFRRAIDLHREELCPGETADWLVSERCILQAERLRALERLLDLMQAQGRWPAVAEIATRILAEDPLTERAHCAMMRAHVASGNRPLALAQYRKLERLLAEELQTKPMPETTGLVRSLAEPQSSPAPRKAATAVLAVRLDAIARELRTISESLASRRRP